MAAHMTAHLPSNMRCCWPSCTQICESMDQPEVHLEERHGIYTQRTIPIQAKFCYECSMWAFNILEWPAYVLQNYANPDVIYSLILIDGIVAAPRRRPWCMQKGFLPQLEKPSRYKQYIQAHLDR
ncbi:hypothetical protein GQ44DRAFT_494021 [Phaeosphaeriaceae sp. PMI808]|nr:hypothetical protein GQ44DRAFT_494021 [Phaeosphaeriaceae sp. PMI808]